MITRVLSHSLGERHGTVIGYTGEAGKIFQLLWFKKGKDIASVNYIMSVLCKILVAIT
jgi:hypothetical protein